MPASPPRLAAAIAAKLATPYAASSPPSRYTSFSSPHQRTSASTTSPAPIQPMLRPGDRAASTRIT